jgi:hypothetical protein
MAPMKFDLVINLTTAKAPGRVTSHIESRHHAVRRWAQAKPILVIGFEEARQKWLATTKL